MHLRHSEQRIGRSTGRARMVSFATVYQRVVAHWRAITLVLILALGTFLIAHAELFLLFVVALLFIASQIFWIKRIIDVGEWLLPGQPSRARVAIIVGLAYLFLIAYSYPTTIGQGHTFRVGFYRLPNTVDEAVFWWWFVGSMLAFVLVIVFGIVDRAARAAVWVYCKARRTTQRRVTADSEVAAPSPSRRHFLQQASLLVSATPFVAAGYGLLYGRLDVEIVRQRIRLVRLPKAFEGFRIAQLSDIHIGPFTTADYIRRCVAITNRLEPDLIALTGDYISWDPDAQGEVVRVLAGLRAPHGVFGCMGNHEADVGIEESITRLFAAQGIHMLRQERAPIRLRDDTLNLIGIDHGGDLAPVHTQEVEGYRRLQRLKALVMPNTVNILLTHYPHFFDHHSELGIDLTLAGDIHGGGQMLLDFVHRGLNLGSLMGVPYIRGLYEKGGAQVYMNRGIGITGFPIRLGARPEITVFELSRT